jgi:hypothetical protein
MRKVLWCFFLTFAAVFAQDPSSGNAAADELKKRVMRMDMLNLKTPKPITLAGPVTAAPTVCSIPLLNVVPPGTLDKMHVVTPRTGARRGDTLQVPAPACGAAIFTNR